MTSESLPGGPVAAGPAGLSADGRYRAGSSGYRRVTVAMFASGGATFALLHNPQAVLPLLSDEFSVSPADASLAVSVATVALAVGVIPFSVLSERFGRVRIMTISIIVATTLGLLTPLCPSYPLLLGARAAQGIALSGLPAVAIAYLAEEMHPEALAGSVGVFIAGNSIGGLAGRLLAGLVGDLLGWQAGLASVAVLAVACCVVAILLLPRQRHFHRARVDVPAVLMSLRGHLSDSRLVRLYGVGFVLMGTFATLYNYLGYRLLRPPFSLSPAVIGLVFLAYLAGTASSAGAGRMTERAGPRLVMVAALGVSMLGALATVPDLLPVILLGVVVQTIGFFAAHSVASGWVGQLATTARAQATSLYTLSYYIGSSVGGWAGGLVYERSSWLGLVAYLLVLFALAVAAGVSLREPRPAGQRVASP